MIAETLKKSLLETQSKIVAEQLELADAFVNEDSIPRATFILGQFEQKVEEFNKCQDKINTIARIIQIGGLK